MNWTQVLASAAAVITALTALFALANRYLVGKITTAVRNELIIFRQQMDQEYVTRREYDQTEEHGKEIHGRHDQEIALLWSHFKK